MKAFLVLVILAAGGWFGYQWVTAEGAETYDASADSEVGSTTPDADETAEGSDHFGAALVASDRERAGRQASGSERSPRSRGESANGASAQRSSGGNGAAAEALPQAMRDLRKRSDARWQEILDAGENPVTHADTVRLARDYSRVLRATYGKPGLQAVAEELLAERLQPLADSLFFSSAPLRDDASGFVQSHVVQSGENPNDIGRAYGMSYQFINMLRGADPESGNLRVGERLKVFDLKDRGYQLYISKSEFRMDLFVGDIFARRYDVGIGEDITPTPAGTTHITAREREPQWTDPKTSQVYDYGHPGHIIGPVWLAFDPKIGRNGLGIHGYTGSGNAVGTRESNGCVRMRNDEVRELYNILVPCATTRDGRFISRAPMTVTIIE
ncbi:MAG: hypothetical protein EA401_02615 [Planctomycetota bacterium]|nr:MAG: hypothetical protein EA401_02615 [Planctomycetota bacterium]